MPFLGLILIRRSCGIHAARKKIYLGNVMRKLLPILIILLITVFQSFAQNVQTIIGTSDTINGGKISIIEAKKVENYTEIPFFDQYKFVVLNIVVNNITGTDDISCSLGDFKLLIEKSYTGALMLDYNKEDLIQNEFDTPFIVKKGEIKSGEVAFLLFIDAAIGDMQFKIENIQLNWIGLR
jgi:hypothetical protein